jgi:hypothetical protein
VALAGGGAGVLFAAGAALVAGGGGALPAAVWARALMLQRTTVLKINRMEDSVSGWESWVRRSG